MNRSEVRRVMKEQGLSWEDAQEELGGPGAVLVRLDVSIPQRLKVWIAEEIAGKRGGSRKTRENMLVTRALDHYRKYREKQAKQERG